MNWSGDRSKEFLSYFPMPNAQSPMPNPQCPMPNAQCPMPNAQSNLTSKCRTLITKSFSS
ncbi:MAG: histidine kinase [Nostoc sp.]|uniref:histidine kinase n=1 Tax=Nostoc sp. TaxID=1180 RepID=UPI002FF5CA1B